MSQNSNSSGIGFPGLLTLLFIGLKLGHVIDWRWVWVLSPLWISFGLFGVFLFILLIFVAVKAACDNS